MRFPDACCFPCFCAGFMWSCRDTAVSCTAGTTSSGARLLSGSLSLAVSSTHVDLGETKAGELDVEVEVDKVLKLDRERLAVPASLKASLLSAST